MSYRQFKKEILQFYTDFMNWARLSDEMYLKVTNKIYMKKQFLKAKNKIYIEVFSVNLFLNFGGLFCLWDKIAFLEST